MANNLNRLDANFPTFTGNESPRQMVAMLADYMYQMMQELQYAMQNLDSDNFNEGGLADLKLDTVKDVKETIKELAGKVQDLGTGVADLEKAVKKNADGLQTTSDEVKRLGDRQKEQDLSFQPDGKGGGILGREGQTINILGTVLINGTPIGG